MRWCLLALLVVSVFAASSGFGASVVLNSSFTSFSASWVVPPPPNQIALPSAVPFWALQLGYPNEWGYGAATAGLLWVDRYYIFTGVDADGMRRVPTKLPVRPKDEVRANVSYHTNATGSPFLVMSVSVVGGPSLLNSTTSFNSWDPKKFASITFGSWVENSTDYRTSRIYQCDLWPPSNSLTVTDVKVKTAYPWTSYWQWPPEHPCRANGSSFDPGRGIFTFTWDSTLPPSRIMVPTPPTEWSPTVSPTPTDLAPKTSKTWYIVGGVVGGLVLLGLGAFCLSKLPKPPPPPPRPAPAPTLRTPLVRRSCSSCSGSGYVRSTCAGCGGIGFVEADTKIRTRVAVFEQTERVSCPMCESRGSETKKCSSCSGRGYFE